MIRLILILVWAALAAGAAAADEPWAGDWQITWGNGGALVTLTQDGKSVGGSLGNGRGLVEGTVEGSHFEGQIVYNGETEKLTATLSPDQASFAGLTEAGDWLSGTRIPSGQNLAADVSIDLDTPRNTMRSFLQAASLARDSKSYALAAAIEALDFGGDAGWTSRDARFEGAMQMFELIDRATFGISDIPDDTADSKLTLSLPQSDSKSAVSVDMQRGADGKWRILMPAPAALRAALDAAGFQPADGFRLLQSPRDTLRTFLEGTAHWTEGGEQEAISTIDLSRVPEVLRNIEGGLVSQYLVRIIDRVGRKTLQYVPNSGASREPFVLFELPAGRIVIEPVGTGADTRWKFSAETASDARALYRAAEQLPDAHALDPSLIPYSSMFALRDQVKRHAPALLGDVPGSAHVEYWQVLSMLAVITLMILTAILLRALLLWVMRLPIIKSSIVNPERLATALGLTMAFLVGSRFITLIGLPAAARQYTLPVFGTLLLMIILYAAWQIVALLLAIFERLAEKTETAIDNILITFVAGVAKLALVIAGVMGVSFLWSLPTSGLLAGLGISGLAVAFASKETLSNVFGAGILLGDRPFRKGDRIIAGDVNGWVEAVGLRSTRIRTLHDSLLVVPNGKLADMVVNNLGARRRRNLSTTVIVTSGATPQRMEAFTNAIRQRIAADPIFVDKFSEVNISRMWTEGIDVEISATLETRSGRSAREATHKLYLDIMLIAEANGLTLAHATDISTAAE